MTTRLRRKNKKQSTRRLPKQKQHGGGGELIYIFEDKYGNVISSADIQPNKKYTITMVEKRGESIISHCLLKFEFERLGEISWLRCDSAHTLEPFKNKSYLIIQQCLQALKAKGINIVHLLPVSDVKKGYMKLYNFYKQIGFTCISDADLDHIQGLESNDERSTFISSKQSERSAFLDRLVAKNKAGSLESKNVVNVLNSCTYMVGNIDELLSNVDAKIAEWTSK
jgi:hypothetical protein